jgi:hypothetical protein
MRCVLLIAATAVAATGCTSESTSRDELAGTWRSARGSSTVELRADGSVDMPLTTDQRCSDDAAGIAACKAKARWDRRGAHVRLWPAMLVSHGSGGEGFIGMYDNAAGSGSPACVCKVDPEPTLVDIRDRDTLAVGDEVITRVR